MDFWNKQNPTRTGSYRMGDMNRIFLSGCLCNHPIFQTSIIPSATGKIADRIGIVS